MRRTTKEAKKNKKVSKNLIIISIILLIISLLIKKTMAIRTILYLLSLVVLVIGIKYKRKKFKDAFFIFIVAFAAYIILDGIIVVTFKRIPIFSYNIITTGKTRVYNSIGVRVWQCDKDNYKDLVVDPFYNKGYICDVDEIDPIQSNSFLNSVIENYDEYKNTYVKITGKISKKNGQNSIEMQPYTTTDITVNGYVTFADNITLRILFKQSEPLLDQYDVYDEITVVGIIKNMEQSHNKYVVYMYDTKISSNINLNDYKITTVNSNKCTLSDAIYSNEKNILYKYCLEDIIVSFGEDNQYELATALSSNKITIRDLYYGAKEETNEEDGTVIYRLDNYSLLICDSNKSNKIVIGNAKMKFSDINCD